jgi:uncharacterized protein YunC (DUF1805 family)
MISCFFSLILFLISPASVFATDATSSADSSDVQTIREVVQQKVKEKLNIISTPSNKPKAFFGTIQKITDNQIDITLNNGSKTIITSDDTVFVGLKKTKIALKDLKSGQEILAMGYLNSQNQLEAKRIVVFEIKGIENKTQVINGQIVDISQSSPVFVIVPYNNKNSQYQIETTAANLKKLSSGQKVIAIVKPDEKIANTFNLLKIIPTEASVSATPTPKN